MRTVPLLAGALLSLALATPAAAQQAPVVSSGEMDAALLTAARRGDEDRTVVQRVLHHPEVEAAARGAGLGGALEEARGRVAGLDGNRLTRAAAHARTLESQLAGGQTFVISATTLIIILLVLIILILIIN